MGRDDGSNDKLGISWYGVFWCDTWKSVAADEEVKRKVGTR